ncbi:MAG: PrgI family protein [Candidatus Moranbacteria bacterium]|nr:PrgI family protein [Candidatus Moranbacteria bacterium]
MLHIPCSMFHVPCSMLFNVPQFIDKEDKIVGPLTAKQLGWMFGMGAVLLVTWNLLDVSAFFISCVPIAAIFGAFAFYRPYNQPLISFITSSVVFVFKPKLYFWKRIPEKAQKAKIIKKIIAKKEQKKISEAKITEISKLLEQGK